MNSYDLNGKTAIITGGAQGIGKSISRVLASKRCHVNIVDIDEPKGLSLEKELKKEGHQAQFIQTDLQKEEQIKNMVDEVTDLDQELSIIVNCARPYLQRKTDDLDFEQWFSEGLKEWDKGFDVFLKAPALILKYALPSLRRADHPSIVNIGSTNAYTISKQPMTYHICKAGIIHMTKYLAYELGHMNIRVNSISPGLVQNDDSPDNGNSDREEHVSNISIPLEKPTTHNEIGETVVFLCSPYAKSITGQDIIMDGGTTLGDQPRIAQSALNWDKHDNDQ